MLTLPFISLGSHFQPWIMSGNRGRRIYSLDNVTRPCLGGKGPEWTWPWGHSPGVLVLRREWKLGRLHAAMPGHSSRQSPCSSEMFGGARCPRCAARLAGQREPPFLVLVQCFVEGPFGDHRSCSVFDPHRTGRRIVSQLSKGASRRARCLLCCLPAMDKC